MRFLKRSLVGVFLVSVTLALLVWAGNTVRGAVEARMNAEPRSFPQRERVFAVNVVTVTPDRVTPVLQTFGEVRAERSLVLRSPVGGTVQDTSSALVEGGAVTAGEVLLRIDPTSVTAVRDRARADLQDAEASLRDAERGLALARDELAAAQGQAELRAQALTRARDLETRGVGTTANVEAAELAASSADAAVLARRQALASSQARLDQATTQLARQRINLQEAERTLADTEVTALFAGTLAEVTIAPGGRLNPNEAFATLLDPTRLEVAFRVSTSTYARLLRDGRLPDLPVTVRLDVSGVDLQATGRIIRESAAVGQGQTGRLLFAALDAAPGFRPGDFVTVLVAEPALDGVALVPASAVASNNTVLVVNAEDRLESAAVTVLRRQGDDVIVEAGALAGARIVAERSPLLGAGIGVRPIDPEASAETPEEDIVLDEDRRARLIAFVEGGRMPDDVKSRIISQLEQPQVPAATVARLEARMGS